MTDSQQGVRRCLSPAAPTPTSPAPSELSEERQARSQEAVAHEAGVTVATLARIERAQANPTWLTVRQVAEALGVTLRELADEVDGRGPSSR